MRIKRHMIGWLGVAAIGASAASCKKAPTADDGTAAPGTRVSGDNRDGAPRRDQRAGNLSPPRVDGGVAAPVSALGFIAKDVHGVVVLRNFFQTLKTGVTVLGTFAGLFGGENPADNLISEVRAKVGINPVDRTDLARIGVDTTREIVVPLNERGQGFAFIVPVSSATAVHRFLVDTIRRIAEEEAQAGQPDATKASFTTTRERGVDITVVPGKLAWAMVGSHVILVPESTAPGAETIRKMLNLAPDKTFAASAELAMARGSLAGDVDGILFLGPSFLAQWTQRFQREVGGGDNDALTKSLKALQGIAFGFWIRSERIKVELLASFAAEERPRIAALLNPKTPASAFSKRLDADAVGFAAVSLNVHEILKRLFDWRPSVKVEWGNLVQSVRERAKVDIDELIKNLSGQGGIAVLDVMPAHPGIPAQLLGPLSQFSIAVYLGLSDPGVFKTFIAEIERAVAQIGKFAVGAKDTPKVSVIRRKVDGVPVYGLGRGKEEAVALAIVNDLFVLASGKGRIERAIAAIKGKSKPLAESVTNPESRKRLGRDAIASVFLNGAQAAKMIPKLLDKMGLVPPSAKGEVSALTKALAGLEAIHLEVTAESPGLRGELNILLKQVETGKQK